MKITIDFGHPYFEENVLLGLTPDDLNCFYADASEVDRLLLCKQVAKFLQIKSKNKGLKNIPFTSTGKGV